MKDSDFLTLMADRLINVYGESPQVDFVLRLKEMAQPETDIDQIQQRHEREIERFISTCKHQDISDWMPYMWAPGHFSGNVKICKRCGKTMEEDKYERV